MNAAPAAILDPLPPVAAPVPKYKVLVVDDDSDVAQALAALLELEGCETLVATSAAEALAQAATFEPLCVLLDLAMPGMSGGEMASRLRTRFREDVVLIAITGHDTQSPQARAARDDGVDYVMQKPVDVKKLVRIMGLQPVPAPAADA